MAAINDATAVTQNFKVDRNDTWKHTLVVKDKVGTTINLANHDLILTLKKGPVIKDSITLDSGLSISGAENDEVTIDHVIALAEGEYNMRLRAINKTSGYKFSLIKGIVEVTAD
jgi:hypothetical protein